MTSSGAGEANSAATFHSNYHSVPRSVCGSASNRRAPLTPLSTVRPYCSVHPVYFALFIHLHIGECYTES